MKKWEKWYWGIILSLLIILNIAIVTQKEFKAEVNGEWKVYTEFSDKLKLSLTTSLILFVFFLIIWLISRLFVKDSEFICKSCNKEYNKNMETEKEVCKNCYEKRYGKGRL